MSQVIYYFTHLFSTEGLPPRWLCGLWPPFQGWFYILSDLGIASAYFAIPLLLIGFLRKKKDIPFPKIFGLFAAFILACGLTHLFDALMFWWPAYRLSGLLYFATAVISWVTVFALIPAIPKALALKTPKHLEKEVQEREQVEKALRESEKRYRTLVESVTDYAIFSLTPEGYVASWNQGAKRIKGYEADEIIGQHFSKFYTPDLVATKFPDYELKVAAKEGRFEDEGWRVRKDGSKFWANVVITALRDENGVLIGFSKVTRDLTERKRAEDQLLKMNEELEQLASIRTESLQKSLEREQLAIMIVNSIRAETDLKTIMMKTINLLGVYTKADRCVFWFYDADTKQYRVPDFEYHSCDSPEILNTKDTAFPTMPVLSSKGDKLEMVNITDVQVSMSDLTKEERIAADERGIRSLLSVPVMLEEKLMGRLQIHTVFEKREWEPETVRMVQQVADQVAIAIYHAQIMQSLQESEARKSAIMESAWDAVIIMNHIGNVVEWNRSAERIFGYRREEVLGQDMARFIIPEHYRPAHHKGLSNYLKTGEGPIMNQLIEMPAVRANGETFIAELTITRVPMAGPALFTGFLRDITDRKRNEQALVESEERFRAMADSSPVMIWMMNDHHEVTYRNKTAEEFTGVSNEDHGLGKAWESRVYPDDLSKVIEDFQQICANPRPYTQECRIKRADGMYRWVLSTGVPRFTAEGELLGFVGTTVDIHEHKMATEELENRVQERTTQLQAANKELEAFSYSVSHDLRAPLRTIDGFSQAILEMYQNNLDARGQDYLHRIRQGSQQMAKLIDDMLQLSRLTRGDLNLEDNVNLSAIVTGIAAMLQEQEPGRVVTFIVEPDLKVRGDKRLLQVVLQNLLDNAWKYTSKHETAHIEFGHLQSLDTVIYYVKDDGAGFDMQYADKLFGAFQRLHGLDEFPGNGVGLATVARIIHRHGGEVWADAEVEKGATFFFTLQAVNVKEMEHAKSFQQSNSPG